MNNALSFSLRAAVIGDEESLYNLIRELAVYERKDPRTLPVTVEKIVRYSKKGLFQTELVEVDKKIIGYALYYYGFSASMGAPILYLEDLFVKPEYRGLGIGSELLKKLGKYAQENECCRMEWHVFEWNQEAVTFYEKMGAQLRKDLIKVNLEIKTSR